MKNIGVHMEWLSSWQVEGLAKATLNNSWVFFHTFKILIAQKARFIDEVLTRHKQNSFVLNLDYDTYSIQRWKSSINKTVSQLVHHTDFSSLEQKNIERLRLLTRVQHLLAFKMDPAIQYQLILFDNEQLVMSSPPVTKDFKINDNIRAMYQKAKNTGKTIINYDNTDSF